MNARKNGSRTITESKVHKVEWGKKGFCHGTMKFSMIVKDKQETHPHRAEIKLGDHETRMYKVRTSSRKQRIRVNFLNLQEKFTN